MEILIRESTDCHNLTCADLGPTRMTSYQSWQIYLSNQPSIKLKKSNHENGILYESQQMIFAKPLYYDKIIIMLPYQTTRYMGSQLSHLDQLEESVFYPIKQTKTWDKDNPNWISSPNKNLKVKYAVPLTFYHIITSFKTWMLRIPYIISTNIHSNDTLQFVKFCISNK